MKVDFTVTSVRKGHVAIDALVGDTKQRVLIDGMEVSLTTDSGRSITLPFHGASLEEAEKAFKPDSKISFVVEGY